MASLEIYVLNVGQADTAIVKTPGDRVLVIDAVRPAKCREVLDRVAPTGEIAHLIVTHPHLDHYSAVSNLLDSYRVERVTLAPFWFEPGTPLYHRLINRMQDARIPVRFISGYERSYPDGGSFPEFAGSVVLELLGPPNDLIEELQESRMLNPNHVSVIVRLTYGQFSMVFAADAQMENWAHYDREGMLNQTCDVLKAAHHGSKRGSQWERLERLGARLVVVSSDPERDHELPDLIGGATFYEYDQDSDRAVALTSDTGTIQIAVRDPERVSKNFDVVCFAEHPEDSVFDRPEVALIATDWSALVRGRVTGG